LRGSALSFVGFGGSNVLRLGSNLILTRLLFPEAFGLMALVQVFVVGLNMFSDLGINASIVQNKRGDDPDFLNTAWTLQICRGLLLWLGTFALAVPAANLYGEPMLAWLLPVVGLNALIAGFKPTNVATAGRHMVLGRLTIIALASQFVGIVVMVILAYYFRSVWGLVIGGLVASVLWNILAHLILPGIRNKLHWDRSAVGELIGFGKYIFLSTAAGFVISQGDRAILGGYISIADLGIYNIGYFLGAVPLMLINTIGGKIIFPLYRMHPPADSARNRANIFRARRMLVALVLLGSAVLAYGGPFIIEILYDPRYALAGPILVLLCLSMVPMIVFAGVDHVLLANGDSRRFFYLVALAALVQVTFLFAGIIWWGIFGAIVAPGLASLAIYPIRIVFIHRYKAWDMRGDLGFLAMGGAVNGFACWLYWDAIVTLIS